MMSIITKRIRNIFSKQKSSQRGFALPTVLFLIVILSTVAYATLLQANNSLNLAYKQSYLQIARMASKSAVDYAQEQFDNSICGNYSGTAEQDLISNNRYRVTLRAEVISTSADGYEKVIKGTGSVYLPRQSETAKYVFDIRSEIVRTYATCKTPADFAPLLWLDASDTDTLRRSTVTTTNITPTPTTDGHGWLDLLLPNDSVEEKVSDGLQGPLSWLSNDLEMHTCDGWEFLFILCSTTGQRDLYTGLVFDNINVPQGATISSATVQFVGATPSGSGGSVTHRIKGIYKSTTNPHLNMFSSFVNNQVRTPMTTAGRHTTAYSDVSSNNFPPGNVVNFDVTNVAQEMINNPNWDPTGAGNGGRMGFGIYRVAGTGTRKTLKDGVRLSINYTTSTITNSSNTETITEWLDKSGNGNHARTAYGNDPTRQDNQINGLPVVRFSGGTLLSSLTTALSGKQEMTVLAVVKPSFSTSDNDGRIVTGMSTTGNHDNTGSDGIMPLFRYGTNSGFSNNYSGNGTSYRTDYTCAVACENRAYPFVSAFTLETPPTSVVGILKGEGVEVGNKTGISPPGPPSPYSYSIDQLYIGGRRSGSMAGGSGADYFNGDYAEIVVYDKALTCRQIESLEDYLRDKWGLSASQYTSTCPADLIPTL